MKYTKVSEIAACVFLVAVACMVFGGLYAIWGDTALGLKVVLTSAIFAVISVATIVLEEA